jgi:DNA-binding XRE family transcriptional regulator
MTCCSWTQTSDAAILVLLLRDARIQQGLTQRELAERLNIHQADISRAERCVTDQYFPAICRELGLDRHSFMRASADAPRSEAQFSVAELAPLLLFIQLELDRSDLFGRMGVGGLDRPEYLSGFAHEHDPPAPLDAAGELGGVSFLLGRRGIAEI